MTKKEKDQEKKGKAKQEKEKEKEKNEKEEFSVTIKDDDGDILEKTIFASQKDMMEKLKADAEKRAEMFSNIFKDLPAPSFLKAIEDIAKMDIPKLNDHLSSSTIRSPDMIREENANRRHQTNLEIQKSQINLTEELVIAQSEMTKIQKDLLQKEEEILKSQKSSSRQNLIMIIMTFLILVLTGILVYVTLL